MKSSKKTNSKNTDKSRIFSILLVGALLIIGTIAGFGLTKTEEQLIEQPIINKKQVLDSYDDPNSSQDKVQSESSSKIQDSTKWPVTYTPEQAASLTVVVNKKHKLPSDYVPALVSVSGGQLRPEAASAVKDMLTVANNNSVPMKIISAYRSYNTQVSTYNKWVEIDGQAQADRSSARAGHSEHQTGLAVDLGMPDGSCNLEICFGDTAQGKWLAENAPNFGFIIRYENNTESITGYQYEPWHLRYVGADVAKAIVASGKTMDQYYNVEAGGY
jgi:D-alanyl-D-alanine carboxypeptidase